MSAAERTVTTEIGMFTIAKRAAAPAIVGLALALAFGLGSAPGAEAQTSYTINGRPTDPATARRLAAIGLPPGHYWLAANGNWGVVGSNRPIGNIHGGAPGGRRRGWTYYPGPGLGVPGGVGQDENGCVMVPGASYYSC